MNDSNTGSKTSTWLNDVIVMRFILVLFLIVYHSFAPFCGKWPTIFDENYTNQLYNAIGIYSYSFFLEGFVFISGIVASHQYNKRPYYKYDFGFIIKKAKRLLLPSIVFSTIYFALFYNYDGLASSVIKIINGCGHMWFLPMLFWCFVGLVVISKFNFHPYIILAISVIIALFSNGRLPMRLGNSLYYFLFFVLGFLIYQRKLNELAKPNIPIISLLLSFFIFSVYVVYIKGIIHSDNVIVNNFIRMISSLSGLLGCYFIVCRNVNNATILPPIIITISKYSFGIYLVQQFILKYLYYYTNLPSAIDFLILPWVACVIALVLSWVTTHIMMKFRIGKFLFG